MPTGAFLSHLPRNLLDVELLSLCLRQDELEIAQVPLEKLITMFYTRPTLRAPSVRR